MIKSYYQERTLYIETISKKKKKSIYSILGLEWMGVVLGLKYGKVIRLRNFFFFFGIVWAEVFLKQKTISFGLFSLFWAEGYNRPT